ncbi:MAG TPA: molybdopterin cofactor-binding domain-containing protein [Gemmatimonadaceae bacterium]|nr:molybdopterin cofactor-binding domain-containing protein [Gemmatimonadaceae bacterium]
MPTNRREFIRNATMQGIVLVVTIPHLSCRATATGESLAAKQWVEIDETGVVTLMLDKMEMGQGVSTALPMIMAEELGADWASVRVVQARPGPAFTEMGTSGSGSVIDAWFNHRIAAAAIRTMLVSAAATQWDVPAVECHTEGGEVRHRGSNRRARFGTLVAAARLLPVPEKPELKPSSEYNLLGTSVSDPGQADIVTGRMTFGIDKRVPGMLFATVARSPVHGGSVRRFSSERALAMTGVRHVVQIPSGVAVVATSTWEAMQGRAALEIEWHDGPNAAFDDAASWRMLEQALRTPGKVARSSGDTRRRLAAATRRIEAEYRWPWQAHAAIEPLNAVAHVKDGGCEIWAGMQNPNSAQARVAEALAIPPERVVVNPMRLGGGFGRRIASDYVVEAAHVSRAIGGPVQVVWTRADDFQHDMYGAAQINRLAAALDGAGRITAWEHRVGDFHLSMFGSYNAGYDPAADGDPWGGFDSPYVVPDLRVDLALVESPVPSGAWRAVTYPAAVMARESFIDEIAHATGADPLAVRMTLIPSPGTITRGGLAINNGDRLRHCLQLAAERANWGRPLPAAEHGRRVGRGIACNSYHRGTMVAQVAEVSVGTAGDIRVHRIVSAVDGGQVINRTGVEKQFEGGIGWALSALFGPGIHFEGGRTVAASFADYPVLRMDQMPAVETHIVESSIRPFGMGEPPVPAVAPAVLNAVFAATGIRIRTLPIAADLRTS